MTLDVSVAPEQLIDLGRYPVTELESQTMQALIVAKRRRLTSTGVSIVPGFLNPAAVARLCREADKLASQAHFSEVSGSPYLERPDRSFREGHPRRAVQHTARRRSAHCKRAPATGQRWTR